MSSEVRDVFPGTVLEFGTVKRGIFVGFTADRFGRKLQLKMGLAGDAYVESLEYNGFFDENGVEEPLDVVKGDFVECGVFLVARAYNEAGTGNQRAFVLARCLSVKKLAW